MTKPHLARMFLKDTYFPISILEILGPQAAQRGAIKVPAADGWIADDFSPIFPQAVTELVILVADHFGIKSADGFIYTAGAGAHEDSVNRDLLPGVMKAGVTDAKW